MKFIPAEIANKFGRQILQLQKASPNILFGVGVVGVVGTTVLACKATLKLDETLSEAAHDLKRVREADVEGYSDRDRTQDKVTIYIRTSVRLAKLYLPAIVVGAASICALTGAHNILTKRNAALTVAYSAVQDSLNKYRERVSAELGVEKERDLYFGGEDVKIKNEETGKAEKVRRVGENVYSPYARFFDELCPSWSTNLETNRFFLHCQQNFANDRLLSRGHIFLNEVYDMLGMDRTQAGAVVGWVQNGDGDSFVDFGIFEADRETVRDFVNGREGAILLDFNVDGVIFDKIES